MSIGPTSWLNSTSYIRYLEKNRLVQLHDRVKSELPDVSPQKSYRSKFQGYCPNNI